MYHIESSCILYFIPLTYTYDGGDPPDKKKTRSKHFVDENDVEKKGKYAYRTRYTHDSHPKIIIISSFVQFSLCFAILIRWHHCVYSIYWMDRKRTGEIERVWEVEKEKK